MSLAEDRGAIGVGMSAKVNRAYLRACAYERGEDFGRRFDVLMAPNLSPAAKPDHLAKINAQRYTLRGETHTVAEWSVILGVKIVTLRHRIKRGLPLDYVRPAPVPVKIPVRTTHSRKLRGKTYDHDGLSLTLKQWADRSGVQYGTLYHRIRNGMSIAEVLSFSYDQNKYVEVNGERISIKEISYRTGINVTSIHTRISKGYSVDEIMSATKYARARRIDVFTVYHGEKVSLLDLSKRTGLSYHVLHKRHRKGKVDDALTAPIDPRRSVGKYVDPTSADPQRCGIMAPTEA